MNLEKIVDDELEYAMNALIEKFRSEPEMHVREAIASLLIYKIVTEAFPTKVESAGVLEAAKQLVWNEGELRER